MWVEIYERGERMFANLGTGQCQWEAPVGEPIKQANLSQWWELFDHSTGYNQNEKFIIKSLYFQAFLLLQCVQNDDSLAPADGC